MQRINLELEQSDRNALPRHSRSVTMTEIFSIWGFKTGRLSQRPGGYQVSADLGDWGIWYVGADPKQLKKEFNKACRRLALRRLLPFLAPPPARLSV